MNSSKLKCKLCRRAGKKLFLKGERCFTGKCAFTKKPYAPGQHTKQGGAVSEYGKQLAQKQTMKRFYGLSEKQFRKYFKDCMNKEGKFSDLLIGRLETRLDNIIYRLGFGESRAEARQLVSHGFFLVNSKPVNIPSFLVKQESVISLKPSKEKSTYAKNLKEKLKSKKKDIPLWIIVDHQKIEGKLLAIPTAADVNLEANPQTIVEFYSR